ncbi:CHAT domain-containing protein [Oscillatoria sp. FACHB-1407]|uniref:CHAT domain-containing protein n=1 Tax=Oscillatoria sp. FACHB-1407 TaxID=2692847 RepID=UPI001F557FE2|nr:CHAT domain-containing protein [Oscillatoria sp. FACHB-1407]
MRRLAPLLLMVLFLVGLAVPVMAQRQSSTTGLELMQQAQRLNQQRRYQEAIALLQQAAQQFATQPDLLNQATALSNLATVYAHVGAWQSANGAIATSLELLQAAPTTTEQQRILATTWEIQGILQLEQGNAQAALTSWTRAAREYEELGTDHTTFQNRLVSIQIQQAQAFQVLGLMPRACQTLLTALQITTLTCEITPDTLTALNRSSSLESIQAMNALGHVLRVLGHLEASQQVLSLALQQAQPLGQRQLIAAIQLHQGNTLQAIANQPTLAPDQVAQLTQAALTAYQQAAQQATQAETKLQAQLNQLSLILQQGDLDTAQTLGQTLTPQVTQLPANRSGIIARIHLAEQLLQLATRSPIPPNLRDLPALLAETMQQAEQLGDPRLQAYALTSQARFEELQHRWQTAEAIANRALTLAPVAQSPDISYQVFWQLGRIQKAKGNRTEAIAQYSRAVEVLKSLRGDLVATTSDVQFSFRERVEPIYRELVSLLLDEASPSEANLRQARQVIESLQLAELDNFFRDACADTVPLSIDEIDPTAAVLYPIILSDRLEIILALPGQTLQHYVVWQSQADLERVIRLARNALRPTAFAEEYLPPAQQLYDWLIRPAETALTTKGIKTLVFVLDGALRNIPMAVLHDGQRFLIESYNLALTSGLQLLSPQPLQSRSLSALVGGLSEANQGFDPLPAVEQEITQVSREVPTEILLNQQFTPTNLQQLIIDRPFPILHLATHGQFSSSAEQTFLLTWNDRLTVRQLDALLKSRDEVNSPPIELLILSACQTAAGDQRATLGMAGIAIRSGARSTLASLWLVNDQPTADLVSEFYRQFAKARVNRAAALRQAQLKLLANPESQHPFYWAAFVLVGNWL